MIARRRGSYAPLLTLVAVSTALLAVALRPAVAHAAPAQALVLADSVSQGVAPDGSGTSLEEYEAKQDGFTTKLVDGTTWDSMTASQFAQYQVLIIGDPTCGGTESIAAAQKNESTWEPVVMSSHGNKALIGTDPTFHYLYGGRAGDKVEAGGIAFAGRIPGATGAYVDLTCAYSEGTPTNTPVPLLDGLSIAGPRQFTVGGAPCTGAISIVAASGPTSGLHDSDLSDWECSVHEFFDHFPSDYTPLAIATDPSVPVTYSATDIDTGAKASGSPYIMIAGKGVTVASSVRLTPASGKLRTHGLVNLIAKVALKHGTPVSQTHLVFKVESGPNAGPDLSPYSKTASGTPVHPNASGEASFSYVDKHGSGTDTVSATYTDQNGVVQKALATVTWSDGACPGVAFIAATGSGQIPDGNQIYGRPLRSRDSRTFGELSPQENYLYSNLLSALGTKTIQPQVVDYTPLGVETLGTGLTASNWENDKRQLADNVALYLQYEKAGVGKLENLVRSDRANCGNSGQKIVLVGYSQGAMVVHDFLNKLARSGDAADKAAIGGVVLIADPERVPRSKVHEASDAPASSEGICAYLQPTMRRTTGTDCTYPAVLSDIDPSFLSVTTSVCSSDDVVCDFSDVAHKVLSNGLFSPAAARSEIQLATVVHTQTYQLSPETAKVGRALGGRLLSG